MTRLSTKILLLPVQALFACSLFCLAATSLLAQQGESVYQRFAPIELTGNWVSIITEDWHLRMITPQHGYYAGLPLSNRGREAADAFDREQFIQSGQACQAYGAARLLREPGRLKISWQDADTLKIETDAGEQTRMLHFDSFPTAAAPSLQGRSVAQWQYAGGFDPDRVLLNPGEGMGRRVLNAQPPLQEMAGGKLYVETDNLTAGLLRKNGVPYSADTEIKEYFNTLREPDGTEWLIVTTIVRDPLNLLVEYITSSNFKREADDSGWNPAPCSL